MDVYKKRFVWPPLEYVHLNESTDVSRGHVFVTAASENHYEFVYVTGLPCNLCVPVVLLRPYGLSYARPWCGFNTRGRHHHLWMQTAVAGGRDANCVTETLADVTRSVVT